MPVYGGPRQFVSKPGQTETDGQLQFSAAVDGTRLYAYQAISAHLRVDHGQASHTPIVVIGDGADVQARGSSAVGIGIGGDIKGQKREIAFQRLNIRGLLCRSEDRDYVNEELEKLGVSVPVTTFDAIKKFRADWKGDLTAYKSLMETLVGRELEM
ncbi:hypothetical protein RO07_16780 [Pandoraea pulmonicola]|nr:hypothetical protein RO07_16780 [Pandoraea pulmonicola]